MSDQVSGAQRRWSQHPPQAAAERWFEFKGRLFNP